MNRIRLMPDYDALLVPKQIAIITESVQALNDICVSLETDNAAIRKAAEALVLKLKDFEYEEWAGNPEIVFADFVEVELTALKEALSRGWLSRGKADAEGEI